jgi:hypothetical protein
LDQLGAQLIGAPALPTLQLARGQQHLVGVVLQFVINEAPMLLKTSSKTGTTHSKMTTNTMTAMTKMLAG